MQQSVMGGKGMDGEKTVRFVAAKAKVTPTKAMTIPRLELMAAVLG